MDCSPRRHPVTSVDLARYRIVYAALTLAFLPTFSWVAEYPDSLFAPPAGLLGLFDGFPPREVLVALELLLVLSLAALVIGLWVNVASIVASGTLLIGSGFTFSLGKIDHIILLSLAPIFLAAAGWDGRRRVSEWVLRLFAYVIGLSVLSAGLAKLLGGWLDPTTHATREWAAAYEGWGSAGPLSDSLLSLRSGWLWEPMDVAAVALECGLILLVVNWRAFRAGLALLAIFHVAVWLLFGIIYAFNVLVYAAFVPWGRVRWWSASPPRWLLVPIAAGAWAIAVSLEGLANRALGPLILIAGAAVGAAYVVRGAPPLEQGETQESAPATLDG